MVTPSFYNAYYGINANGYDFGVVYSVECVVEWGGVGEQP